MQLKVSDRLAIADRIGRELQDRYSYSEIDTYLDAFGVPRPKGVTTNSKWIYAKSALGGVSASKIRPGLFANTKHYPEVSKPLSRFPPTSMFFYGKTDESKIATNSVHSMQTYRFK